MRRRNKRLGFGWVNCSLALALVVATFVVTQTSALQYLKGKLAGGSEKSMMAAMPPHPYSSFLLCWAIVLFQSAYEVVRRVVSTELNGYILFAKAHLCDDGNEDADGIFACCPFYA